MAKRCTRNYQAWLTYLAYFLIIAAGVMFWAIPEIARAQQMGVIAGGELEYQRYCAVCHGSDARGQGVMSKYLTIHPANLTQLAKQNGGKFPFWEVYEKIDGGSEVRGHGTREMPIWGDRFRADAGGDGKAAQTQAAGRILGLVFYLQYIQE
jgi:mono/diheme cytochrome c family protein